MLPDINFFKTFQRLPKTFEGDLKMFQSCTNEFKASTVFKETNLIPVKSLISSLVRVLNMVVHEVYK